MSSHKNSKSEVSATFISILQMRKPRLPSQPAWEKLDEKPGSRAFVLGSMQPCLMANETSFRHAQENSTFCHGPSSIHAPVLNKQNILISEKVFSYYLYGYNLNLWMILSRNGPLI